MTNYGVDRINWPILAHFAVIWGHHGDMCLHGAPFCPQDATDQQMDVQGRHWKDLVEVLWENLHTSLDNDIFHVLREQSQYYDWQKAG